MNELEKRATALRNAKVGFSNYKQVLASAFELMDAVVAELADQDVRIQALELVQRPKGK